MSRQARVVDIHEYYRTGGIDWPRCAENFDAVIIRAAKGLEIDDLFFEHVEMAVLHDMLYITYQVPDARKPFDENVDFYLEIEGVSGAPVCGDVEPFRGNLGSEYFYRKYFERLRFRYPIFDPWYYGNYNYSGKIGHPNWIKDMFLWWAEYPFDILTKYREIDRYLSKNPWKIPKWAVKGGYTPQLHQFTDYGNARGSLANEKTKDPKWKDGIKSADFSVSLIDAEEFLNKFGDDGDPKPDLEERVDDLEKRVDDHESRISDLENE